jgi:hypothetical protein
MQSSVGKLNGWLMPLLGIAFALAFIALCAWQSPHFMRGRLSAAETERYLAVIDRTLPLPAEERARMLSRVRAFAEGDDGRPFHMLNLMRYYDRARALPGAPAFAGTPRDANAYYEERAMPLLFAEGGFPAVGGATVARDLFGHDATTADFDRVLVVRYPSRRAFLELVTDPRYGPIAPYKLIAEDVVLIPVDAEVVLPDMRLAAGALLLVAFLAFGWWRAARAKAPT